VIVLESTLLYTLLSWLTFSTLNPILLACRPDGSAKQQAGSTIHLSFQKDLTAGLCADAALMKFQRVEEHSVLKIASMNTSSGQIQGMYEKSCSSVIEVSVLYVDSILS